MNPKIASFLNSTKRPRRISFSEDFELERVPEELVECKEVEELDFSYTFINSIPEFVFNMPKLRKLSYIGCDIKDLPSGISNLSDRLIELRISIENIENLEELFKFSELKCLEIQGSFENFPNGIEKLQKLEELGFINVNLKKFPEVSTLSTLKKISLIGEIGLEDDALIDFDTFFEEIAKCSSLKVLSIENYRLKNLSPLIGRMGNLELLLLQDNLLESIPDEIFELARLKEIDLSINCLKYISPLVAKLQSLKILRLNSNWRNQLDCNGLFSVIGSLKNLEVLDLSSCQSVRIIPEGLSELKNLKSLDFDNNLIADIPDFLFGMHHLKKLRLSTNSIPQAKLEKLKVSLNCVNVVG